MHTCLPIWKRLTDMKPNAVIFDMDGTLADVSSIRHHLLVWNASKGKAFKNFDKFHEESVNVPPNEHVAQAARDAKANGCDVIIVTARKHKWRNHTAWFLALNDIPSDALFMRGNNDGRPDYEVKSDILRVIKHTWNVVHAWDDNPSVIKLWQENGIPTTVVEGWCYE